MSTRKWSRGSVALSARLGAVIMPLSPVLCRAARHGILFHQSYPAGAQLHRYSKGRLIRELFEHRTGLKILYSALSITGSLERL
jgi:hypothetical protein